MTSTHLPERGAPHDFAARFELQGVAGSGGMGTVHRALDRATGDTVAIKVLHELHGRSAADAERFLREAQLLSQLRHRSIVRYVTHGVAAFAGGLPQPFLAMEWLDGESLDERIARGPLCEADARTLLHAVAGALAAAHAIGVVHRDLKPSNLFLRGGRIEDAVLLDFGIARQGFGFHQGRVTRTGTLIGTPDYMAPEQARGEPSVGPAADVFALGCVLYECLTGRSPFGAEHIAAVLAKILFGEPTPLRQVLPGLGTGLAALIGRMLRKVPQERFADASALIDATRETAASDARQTLTAVMQRSEQQIVSVVMALAANVGVSGNEKTLGVSQAREIQTRQQGLSEALRPFGRAEWLADGSLVVLVTACGSATDQAIQAARCALAVSERWPRVRIAVSTGRGTRDSEGMVGEALERAVRLLRTAPGYHLLTTAVVAPEPHPPATLSEEPLLDELTAGLVRGRFCLTTRDGQVTLHAEIGRDDETRLLLGRPTACVGRDQELMTMELRLNGCIEDSMAYAALVTAPPGVGKSRLRHEFTRRALERHPDLQVLLGQTDPLTAQAPYALLGQVVRRAAGIRDGSPLAVQREQLRALVSAGSASVDQQSTAAFLGELASVPFEDAGLGALRAARQDPNLRSELAARALVDWLRGLLVCGPVMMILEDLHWSDPQSVALLQAALRELTDLPLYVLALARPEALTAFPLLHKIFSQRIELHGLSQRASTRLVQQVLGAQADTATVTRIVAQAQGNALFLEELIRTIAENKGEHLPATVMAMLQVRLERLDVDARRALCAASLFGQTFWRGGVAALLGVLPVDSEDVLQRLVAAELVEPRRESRFPGEAEYVFHHALLGEATYALLAQEERVVGHRLTGEYLERVGEPEPLVLASHFERGAEPLRAGGYYLRAAETAHRGGDRHGTLTCAQRALACGIKDDQQAMLLGLLCEAHAWYAEWEVARGYAQTVMRLSPPASGPWARAAVARFGHVLEPERLADFHEVYHTLAHNPPAEESLAAVGFALMAALYILVTGGEFALAQESLRRLEALTTRHPQHLMLRAWHEFTSAVSLVWQASDLAAAQRQAASARDRFREAGFHRGALLAQVIFGLSSWLLGDHEAAERELRETLQWATDLGPLTSLRSLVLCQVLGERGALDEAEALATKMCAAGRAQRLPSDEGRGQWALAEIRLRRGDLAGAEAALCTALPLLVRLPPEQMATQTVLAEILLRQGHCQEALQVSQQTLMHYAGLQGTGILRARALLLCAESLRACGAAAESRAALRDARECALSIASRIPDAAMRQRYLAHAPVAARILALCESAEYH